ncbi:UDP-glycosyltransferase 87A1-like [Fagus crenata]
MMNLCKLLVSKSPDILISFVVTEEWLSFIGSDPKPANIRFATVPNVIPSELGRAKDFAGFVEAVSTKMEAPFEELLDRLEPPVTAIVADTFLVWIVGLGSRRNIPVASLWPSSATGFSVLHHFELVVQNRHFPVDLSADKEQGDELVDYIPGVSTTRVADLPMTNTRGDSEKLLPRILESISLVSKAQYLLFTSVHELEAQVIDTLKAILPIPVYPIGPAIPYLELEKTSFITNANNVVNYFQWLDSQPPSSVLYISLGSFLSISSAQMEEIVGGVRDSGVRYLWISRGENAQFKDSSGDMGLVDWKIGWRVKKNLRAENFVTRGEISELVKRFMDQKSNEGNEIRKRATKLKETCQQAIAKSGSSETNLDAFIRDISKGHGH